MAKNRIVYAVVLGIVSVFVGLYENKITYTALYAVILLPILCILYMLLSQKKLSVSERVSIQTIKKGEVSQYLLTVKNNSFFPYPVMNAVFQSRQNGDRERKITQKECFFSLFPHESKEIVFDLPGQSRGTFTIGVCKIYLYDPLGLIRFCQKAGGDMTLTVLPNALPLLSLPVSSHGHASEAGKSQSVSFNEDYTSVSQLRKYISTDGYKKIHWKLSAKKNELICKEYNTVSVQSAVMILDNTSFPDKPDDTEATVCEDKLIEAAVSVAAYCEKHMIHTCLYYLCGGLTASVQPPEDLYATVSNIRFGETPHFNEFLLDVKKLHFGRERENIFIFTHNMTGLFCSTVKTLCFSGNRVIIFCFVSQGNIKKKTSKYDKDRQKKIKELRTAGAVCYILSEKRNAADAVAG